MASKNVVEIVLDKGCAFSSDIRKELGLDQYGENKISLRTHHVLIHHVRQFQENKKKLKDLYDALGIKEIPKENYSGLGKALNNLYIEEIPKDLYDACKIDLEGDYTWTEFKFFRIKISDSDYGGEYIEIHEKKFEYYQQREEMRESIRMKKERERNAKAILVSEKTDTEKVEELKKLFTEEDWSSEDEFTSDEE